MFTGLIEEIGVVGSLTRGVVSALRVVSTKVMHSVNLGDSVSVNGVCLTVTAIGSNDLTFDAVPETISRSTLGDLKPQDKVNLEPALTAGKAMGGHFVLGHVDGMGRIESIELKDNSWVIVISAPVDIMRYIVEKGSVAVDGISLTVASCDSKTFTLALIPHTLKVTNLGQRKTGDKVNLETDIIGKYVEKFTRTNNDKSEVTEDLLRKAGFM